MFDRSRAHEIPNGLLFENGSAIFSGTGLPSAAVLNPQVGDFYLQFASPMKIFTFRAGTPNFWDQLRATDIAFAVSTLTAQSPDLVGLTQTFQVVSALANRHFGKRFQPAFTAATFTTTSTTFLDIQSLTTPSLASGNYLAIGYASYQKSLIAGQVQTRIFLNGSTEFGLGQVPMDDDDFWFHSTTFAYLTGLSGVNTVALQMRKSNGGGNIEARNRLLLFLRVD